MSIRIGDRTIGPGHSPFLIAEIGINHNGCLDRARELIDVAVSSGASAVKFQKRHLPSIYTRDVLENLGAQEQAFQYLIPILKEFELDAEQLAELKEYCDQRSILFLCTPFDIASAEELASLHLAAYKVSSADLTNTLLLSRLIEEGKPLILSTGMSVEEEIESAVAQLRASGSEFALLHCVSTYPVDPKNADLGRIRHLAAKYRCPVGYSGHDIGTSLSLAALSLGACIVEKHVTLDREMRGPDHKVSLLPAELKRLGAAVRTVVPTGWGWKGGVLTERTEILQGELMNQRVFRKCVVAKRPIQRGEVIKREMLGLKSPGIGLTGQRLSELEGRIAKRNFSEDDFFVELDLCDQHQVRRVTFPKWGRGGFVVRYHDFESVLEHRPQNLEFHFTYADTLLEVPHHKLKKYADVLCDTTLRVHCCEYVDEQLFDLCSVYPGVLQRSLDTLQRVIDVTSEMASYFNGDKPLIVFNCGAMSLKQDYRSVEVDSSKFHDVINSLALKGTGLIAQNMPPYPWYFGGQWKGHYFLDQQQLIEFCQATGQSLCLDVSHAYMASRYLDISLGDYMRSLRPYVEHLHLGDARSIEGEGVQVGDGSIDFSEIFEIFSDYQGTWIPEIWQGHLNDHAGAKLALQRLNKVYQSLNPLNDMSTIPNSDPALHTVASGRERTR